MSSKSVTIERNNFGQIIAGDNVDLKDLPEPVEENVEKIKFYRNTIDLT